MGQKYDGWDAHELRELLQKQQRNLRTLMLQAADYGPMNVPLHINNAIEIVRAEIDDITAAIDVSSISRLPVIMDNRFSDEHIGILNLSSAYPYYRERDIRVRETNKELYINYPESLLQQLLDLDDSFEFNTDISLDGESNFDDIAARTEISELPELIDKHRLIVAQQFLDTVRLRRPLFNAKKLGVYDLYFNNESFGDENAIAYIEFFRTDFFTHRVFRSIYTELRAKGHPISRVDKYNYRKYHPFTTSFGLNAYVLTKSSHGCDIVFAKRSRFASNYQDKARWHVSMNEGLSLTDIVDRKVSLTRGICRGLNEELGVTEKQSQRAQVKYYNFFLVEQFFEIGLVVCIELDMTFEELRMKHYHAKDRLLEVDELVRIPFTQQAINEFLMTHADSCTPAAIHALRMLWDRELD